MKSRHWIIILLLAIAVGWYNNGGAEFLWVSREMLRLSTRPPDAVLVMPVDQVAVSRIADTWHAPRSTTRKHEGQDIFAPKGTPVRSATRGIVIRIGTNSLGGNVVSILGAGRRSYYYAHLDRFAPQLAIGDFVEAGHVIGYVGNTGNARGTPPHLHFGIYSATGAIDPLPLLRTYVRRGAGFEPARGFSPAKPTPYTLAT